MQRVLITGANRGIGLELVRQYLAQADTLVIATARQPENATDLQALKSERLHIFKLDVTNAEQIAQLVTDVQAVTDGLDVLINNAGILIDRGARLEDITRETMMKTLEVNTVAPLMVAQSLAPLLKRGDQPKLVNVTSQLGSLERKTSGGQYAYCTSKAGVNMVSRALAGDLKADGVTVIMVHPGWVQTDMGGSSASITPEESATGMKQLIDNITVAETGAFYRWDGTVHPW